MEKTEDQKFKFVFAAVQFVLLHLFALLGRKQRAQDDAGSAAEDSDVEDGNVIDPDVEAIEQQISEVSFFLHKTQ